MTDKDIELAILKRLYSGVFEPDVDYRLNLNEFASKLGIENRCIEEIYGVLKNKDFVEAHSMSNGFVVRITAKGILFCEDNHIVSEELMQHQRRIRTRLLDAAATLQKEKGQCGYISYSELCQKAGVTEQDFNNNIRLITACGLLECRASGFYQITPEGVNNVEDYRARLSRLERFEKLKNLDGVTEQQRGHELENLLSEIARYENWEVETRVRSQGQEIDIIMHVGTHYFFISCKWEKNPVQTSEVELLESRVRSRAMTNAGLLFSMSGFSAYCIEEASRKIQTARILLFGPLDIENIFSGQTTLQNLLDKKLEQAMHHRKILVDGAAK